MSDDLVFTSRERWVHSFAWLRSTRIMLAVHILMGLPVCYRMKFNGPVVFGSELRHARIVQSEFRGPFVPNPLVRL